MKYLISLMAVLLLTACNTTVNAPTDTDALSSSSTETETMLNDEQMESSSSEESDVMDDMDDSEDTEMEVTVGGDAVVERTPGEFSATLIGTNFAYDIEEIRVKKGDTVRLTLRIGEGVHDLVIDEYDVRTDVIRGDEEQTIEFTADQVGTFAYYCSVGSHRANGMEGMLIVEE